MRQVKNGQNRKYGPTIFSREILSKIIFSEKSLSVHMSVPSLSPSPSRHPKKSLKLNTLLSKVVRYTLRDATATATAAAAAAAGLLGEAKQSYVYTT